MLAVFQNVGKLCIAAAIRARFGKADLDVVVALTVQLDGRQTERLRQFAGGARIVLCPATDYREQIAPHLCQNDLPASLQNFFRNTVGVLAQTGELCQKLVRQFEISLCQQ